MTPGSTYEKQLEEAVRHELEALPELPVPAGLSDRILRRIQAQAEAAPWFRRPWPAWPTFYRYASFCVLVAGLTAMGLALYRVSQTSTFASVSGSIGIVLDRLALLERTLEVVLDSLKLVVHSLSTLQLAVVAMVGAACYALCVSLGTLIYRMAFVRR